MTGSEFDWAALLAEYSEVGQKIETASRELGALDSLVRVAVDTVPGVDYASCTGRVHDRYLTRASSSDVASRADQVQYELGTGPCVDAVIQDAVFRSSDLAHDPRWVDFGPRVNSELGLCSVLSLRLVLESDDLSTALNLYSSQLDAFDSRSEVTALLLATHGARLVATETAQHMEHGLKNSRTIGVAMGILMNQHKITGDNAFQMLRIASQNGNRKLADIADGVAVTGALPAPVPGSSRDRLAKQKRPERGGTN